VAGANNSHGPPQKVPLVLPIWRDWLGQPNTLVPIAVAVGLWDSAVLPPGWLSGSGICAGTSKGTLRCSSWSTRSRVRLPDISHGRYCTRVFLGEVQRDLVRCGWQLTRARFSKLEEAADVLQPCVALIHVGFHMLEFSVVNNAGDAAALASLLADAIDEVRYTRPEIGIVEWSTIVGKLAGVMAASGLLKTGGCERLLARYDGDDASLAAAVVNAAANGVPASEVRSDKRLPRSV
jgi:hypothetical protein